MPKRPWESLQPECLSWRRWSRASSPQGTPGCLSWEVGNIPLPFFAPPPPYIHVCQQFSDLTRWVVWAWTCILLPVRPWRSLQPERWSQRRWPRPNNPPRRPNCLSCPADCWGSFLKWNINKRGNSPVSRQTQKGIIACCILYSFLFPFIIIIWGGGGRVEGGYQDFKSTLWSLISFRHLRTRRALLLYKVYGSNALLALNWRFEVWPSTLLSRSHSWRMLGDNVMARKSQLHYSLSSHVYIYQLWKGQSRVWCSWSKSWLVCPFFSLLPTVPSCKMVFGNLSVYLRDANHFNILSGRIGLRIREVCIKCVQFNGSSQSKNQGGTEICAAIHTKIIHVSGSLPENQGGLASLLSYYKPKPLHLPPFYH